LEVKVLYTPGQGEVLAERQRVSIARWNLKQAVGKALA
jgi:hypothetical protein